MMVMPARNPDAATEHRTDTFSGDVWGTPIVPAAEGVMVNHVHFAPGGRSNGTRTDRPGAHRHRGRGPRADRGRGRARHPPGDVVWIPAGERHWHGAGPDSFMAHIAVSIGPIDWQDR